MCSEWRNSFFQFQKDMGNRPGKDYVLTRKDLTKDFTKENCIWMLKSEHQRRPYMEGKLTAGALARMTGYSKQRVQQLSGIGKKYASNVLIPFIDEVVPAGKTKHIFYKPSAIEFLKKRREARNI